MNLNARLKRLEQANGTTVCEGEAVRMRTPEEMQIGMELWLHCHQITHDEIDREAALAHARLLHQTPVIRSRLYQPMPVDVQNEIDAHKAEIEREHAALPAVRRAELDKYALDQAAMASTFLAEAGSVH